MSESVFVFGEVCACVNVFSAACVFVSVCCVCCNRFRECEGCFWHIGTHRFTHSLLSVSVSVIQTENSHLLTIQPDLTTTTTSYQGTLRSRHDATAKFSMTNGPLLDPLPNGSHTLHNGKLNPDPAEFVSRFSTQSYFKTLPRDVANTSYGTFNFLGGRLTIPNTGLFFSQASFCHSCSLVHLILTRMKRMCCDFSSCVDTR